MPILELRMIIPYLKVLKSVISRQMQSLIFRTRQQWTGCLTTVWKKQVPVVLCTTGLSLHHDLLLHDFPSVNDHEAEKQSHYHRI